ncbi:MAG: UDP-N-acetylmuramoyl-L-alanine--D-glutamate ligase [Acidimicrobiales bacterium]
MTLDELATRRVAVWGVGQEGRGITRLLVERGAPVVLVDDRPEAAEQAALELDVPTRPITPDVLADTDIEVVVRSPGVSRYRTELLDVERAGVEVTTPMAVWLEDFADARVLAVTGTKGKSTTSALAAAILAAGGTDVALIGNIGVPVTDTYGQPRSGAYVVEVSSYQGADVTATPPVCVLTSLAPDHLDWHRGLEQYYRDKLRLIEAGPIGELAVNAASEEAVLRTTEHPRRTLFGPAGQVRLGPEGVVEVDGEPLADTGRLRVPGVHNRWNLCGAVAGVMLLEGRPPTRGAVESAMDGFEALPSRCHVIGERDSLTYVDDALASNPFATAASIEAFAGRDLTVIVGGADRGVAPTDLVEALRAHRPVPRLVVLPPDPSRLVDSVYSTPGSDAPVIEVRLAEDLTGAVALAAASTPSGGVVLFSPGAPTPEGEGGFAVRSGIFREAAGLSGAT